MATLNIEMYLHKQTQMYQSILHTTRKMKQTIAYQKNLKQHRTIPKHLSPHPLTLFGTTTLTETFKTQYRNLFFQHLDEVLIHNQTILELQQTKLTNIITDTERQLSTSKESTEKVTQYYHQFLADNKITNHETLPTLKAKLTKTTQPQTTPTTSTLTPSSLPNKTHQHHPKTANKPPHKQNQHPTMKNN